MIGAIAGTLLVPLAAEPVRISELMYHPASEDSREEFIELHNPGPAPVQLAGWRFSTGVRFTFPDVVLPPGGWLAVAADLAVFASNHPTVTNVVGNWEGILSNSGQLLELVDAQGRRVDAVRYADEGDWALRERAPEDYGRRGLRWTSAADGGGRSLELVNLRLPGAHGQNWLPSLVTNGTPGAPNSVARDNTAPLILDAAHFPLVPNSTQSVSVTVRLLDETPAGLHATLHHRRDGEPAFTPTPMADDGRHGDGAADDGVFGGVIPAAPNNTVVEFYIVAADAEDHTRTYPAPVSEDGVPAQVANLLYQVDDAENAGPLPLYRLVLLAADLSELRAINAAASRSHAQYNAAFLSRDNQRVEWRSLVGVRNRGNGSRGRSPQSFRVNFRNDALWNRAAALNLNSQQPHAQLLGSALYRRAGLPTQEARAVDLRVNNARLATAGLPSLGFYVANEVLDSVFAAHHFPGDSSGNLYRGLRLEGDGADLHYEGETPDPYRVNYFKRSNNSEDDWTDLIRLTRVLDTEPDATYAQAVRQWVNVEEWMLYFALETLVDNRETNLANGNNGTGEGDDYFLYFGREDPRAQVIPYDLDTILGQGDSAGRIQDGLFRMAANPVMARFVQHPEFVPVYYATLRRLADTVLSPAEFDPLVDQVLGALVPASIRSDIKTFTANRRAFVLSEIPQALVVSNALPYSATGRYFVSTSPGVALAGLAEVIHTRTVTVNGAPAEWTAWRGTWQAPNVPLRSGFNRLLVQTWDATGHELARAFVDVLYAPAVPTPRSGTLEADTVWTAAAGPYRVTGALSVPAGVTLTIEPGTTVAFAAGTGLEVRGRLLAEGTEAAPIAFLSDWSVPANWAGVRLQGTGPQASRLAWVHFEGVGGAGTANVRAVGSTLLLDHCTFTNTAVPYVDLVDSSFNLRRNVFPRTASLELIHGSGLPANGFGILQGNWFGGTTGYNDIIDHTGGNRPDAIVQFLDNVFTSGTDDGFDMDGTDAHIEGNIFLDIRQDTPRESTSNAVSTGQDGDHTSELTVVRNIFANLDHALLLKDAGSAVFHHNTVVNIRDNPNDAAPGALITFYEARSGVTSGRLADVAGNIVWDVVAGRLANDFTNPPARFIARDNVLPAQLPAGAEGTNNVIEDPRFAGYPGALTPENVREALRLRPGSPALGTGPNGLDMGALVPAGASVAGEPPPRTWRTNVVLTVGGPGITHYKFRLLAGPLPATPDAPPGLVPVTDYSEERPVSEPIQLTGLTNGAYQVRLLGRNSAGTWQVEDAAPGADWPIHLPEPVPATHSRVWLVDTQYARLRINEILARNTAWPTNDAFPDLVELHNDSAAAVDLSGLRLTTDPGQPGGFVFPAGMELGSDEYLVLLGDNATTLPGLHLGFAFKHTGEALYLFDRVERGGALLDSVTFGPQIADLSIGRDPAGRWRLCVPTLGAPNQPARTGDPARLRLNEWLAAADTVFRDDFIELYNADPLPVALDGLWLGDHPASPIPGAPPPPGQVLPPLSFIAGQGFAVFVADGHPERGADHLAFQLAGEQGLLSLATLTTGPDNSPVVDQVLDAIVYGPQTRDVSQGRSPNGATQFAFFEQPSPGGGNPGTSLVTNVTQVTLDLVSLTNRWRYHQTGPLADGWQAPNFADADWPEDYAVFWHDSDPLNAPTHTPLVLGQITYYFRTRFDFPTNTAGFELRARTVVDDGLVAYLNGHELFRHNLDPNAAITPALRASRTVDDARLETPFTGVSEHLLAGENVLAVEVHQASSGSSDVVFGLELQALLTLTNPLPGSATARLSEVFASSPAGAHLPLAAADFIELFNPTAAPVDLADASLTDDPGQPRRWVFPPGSVVPAGGYLAIACQSAWPASATNTGFGLSARGGGVFFFAAPGHGGGQLDAVRYGLQAAGYSLSRSASEGDWTLSLPTPGEPNLAATLGNPSFLAINEWMAHPATGDDWFELYNPNPQPVALGGLFLTDDLNDRARSGIPPLSFIAPGDFLIFQADGHPEKGADHVAFKLATEGESIGLFTAAGELLNAVTFGPQTPGVSEGRVPDGGSVIVAFLDAATPGASNGPPEPPDTDADGLPDDWERLFGLDPVSAADATADLDHDGLVNRDEYLAGTRPNDPLSRLDLAVSLEADRVRLRFNAGPGRTYSLLYRDSLGAGAWIKLQDAGPFPVEGPVVVEDVAGPQATSGRYYLLVTPARP